MADIGAPELLIVLVVALLVLGPTRLPKVARSLGEAVREFHHHRDEPAVRAVEPAPSEPPVAAQGETAADPAIGG